MPTEFKVDAEVKPVVGSVDGTRVVSGVELLASVVMALGWVSTLTVVVSGLRVVSGLLELSTRED